MSHSRRALSALVLLITVALCAAACSASTSHFHPLIGRTAPDVAAEPLGGEGPKTFKEALGKVVILDFFATYCGPCKKSFPAYQHIAEQFAGDVVVIAVSVDEPDVTTKDQILAFARQNGARFSILWDKDGSVRTRYAPEGYPSAFIIDQSGTVRRFHISYAAGYEASLADDVRSVLAAPATAPREMAQGGGAAASSVHKPRQCGPLTAQGQEAVVALRRRCPDDACRKGVDEAITCGSCLTVSCCAEVQACDRDAFPPDSASRTEAARCTCLLSGSRKYSRAYAESHCGPPNDLFSALSACLSAHCADVCPEKQGAPAP